MSLSAAEKAEIIKTYQKSANDTGTSPVQIALLTHNIIKLTEHFKIHKHDHHSRRGLLHMVEQRRKLLTYIKRTDYKGYRELIAKLGLRG